MSDAWWIYTAYVIGAGLVGAWLQQRIDRLSLRKLRRSRGDMVTVYPKDIDGVLLVIRNCVIANGYTHEEVAEAFIVGLTALSKVEKRDDRHGDCKQELPVC